MPLPRRAVAASMLAVLLGAVLVLGAGRGALAMSLCPSLPPPDECPFGEALDFCGRRVCARGPGERCGGPANIHGRCGEGMHCKCERCIGCSLVNFICDMSNVVCG